MAGRTQALRKTIKQIALKGATMKKEYKSPKAEKLEFDYTETVTASNGKKCSGGIYRMFVEKYSNCKEKETEVWVNPYGNQ